jgi:hypothetical protein
MGTQVGSITIYLILFSQCQAISFVSSRMGQVLGLFQMDPLSSRVLEFLDQGSATPHVSANRSHSNQIPVYSNADLLEPPSGISQWPIIMFSHGLAGSRNMYRYVFRSEIKTSLEFNFHSQPLLRQSGLRRFRGSCTRPP